MLSFYLTVLDWKNLFPSLKLPLFLSVAGLLNLKERTSRTLIFTISLVQKGLQDFYPYNGKFTIALFIILIVIIIVILRNISISGNL